MGLILFVVPVATPIPISAPIPSTITVTIPAIIPVATPISIVASASVTVRGIVSVIAMILIRRHNIKTIFVVEDQFTQLPPILGTCAVFKCESTVVACLLGMQNRFENLGVALEPSRQP